MFRSGRQKIPRKEGKKVFSLFFKGPSSPRPAFGSSGPPNNFKAKGLARLGELQPPQGGLLPINRHPRGVLKGFKVQKLRELREERNKRKRGRGATKSRP